MLPNTIQDEKTTSQIESAVKKQIATDILPPEIMKLLASCATVIKIPVEWGDMNAGQHISNIVYFRYLEIARTHFFELVDFAQRDSKRDVGIVLADISCKFRSPLTYPDTLSVGTKVINMQKDRFTMKHILISHKHQKLAAEGEATIVTYNYKKQCKTPIPDFLIQRLDKLGSMS